MISIKRYIALALLPLTIITLLGGCSQEEIVSLSNGRLHLNIGHVSQETMTRATPSQLGKPLTDKFNLKIQRTGSELFAYNGAFISNLELNVGTYNIIAYYGENLILGKDCPYYEGVATATIEEGLSTSVTIPCRVANALVSVNFGRNEEEKSRFDKFYENYGLRVRIGSHSLDIPYNEAGRSIYFPAGSCPTLIFYGTLRENGQIVSCELHSEDLPVTFDAADHATITLTLPNPESALSINISKVEMETVTIEETIPLSWLPAPVVTAQHRYDDAGYLLGTDVAFSNSYPGMPWRAVVTNANGQVTRSIEAGDRLLSSYDSSSEHPYLPSGEYKATYYIVDGAETKEVSSVTFGVGKPELRLIVGGYTSYSKFLEGDIDGANACDGKTVYDLLVELNVSDTVLAKNDYTFTFRYGSGYTENVEAGKNRFYRETVSNQAASFEPYHLEANVTFDGVSLSGGKDFYITGLPATYAPPTASDWTATSNVTFSGSEAKLNGNNTAITNAGFAIPAQTKVVMDYNVKIRAAKYLTTTNKFTITIGSTEVFSESLRGGILSESTKDYSGSKTYTSSSQTTTIKCTSSKQYTSIYSLSLKYSK